MKLGIIAGGGDLPQQLAAQCRTDQISHHVFVIEGQGACETLSPCSPFRLGAIGHLVQLLRREAITDLVFIGSVKKPSLWSLRPDWFLIRHLIRLGFLRGGDDSLLRKVAQAFERQLGVTVRGIHEFMPQLLAPAGVIGAILPPATWNAPLAEGVAATLQHGGADKGQAIVMGLEGVLAVEGRAGTAAMLQDHAAANKAQPGILIKLAKPQQDLRLDLPTIGPATVQQAAAAGLAGIVIEAEKTLIVDQAQTAAAADRTGIFLLGLRP